VYITNHNAPKENKILSNQQIQNNFGYHFYRFGCWLLYLVGGERLPSQKISAKARKIYFPI